MDAHPPNNHNHPTWTNQQSWNPLSHTFYSLKNITTDPPPPPPPPPPQFPSMAGRKIHLIIHTCEKTQSKHHERCHSLKTTHPRPTPLPTPISPPHSVKHISLWRRRQRNPKWQKCLWEHCPEDPGFAARLQPRPAPSCWRNYFPRKSTGWQQNWQLASVPPLAAVFPVGCPVEVTRREHQTWASCDTERPPPPPPP